MYSIKHHNNHKMGSSHLERPVCIIDCENFIQEKLDFLSYDVIKFHNSCKP